MTVRSSMIVAGIDPGKTGAMVVLWPDGVHFGIERVPLAGKNPAWSQWADAWRSTLEICRPELIVIENVGSMPRQGVASTFRFGEALGFVHALALSVPARIEWPTPATWKRKMGLSADKNASREEARRLIPGMASELARVKDDGVAEAALLAWYGLRYLIV